MSTARKYSRTSSWLGACGAAIVGALAGLVLPAAAGSENEAASYSELADGATASGYAPRFTAVSQTSRVCETLFVGGVSFPGNTRAGVIPNTTLTFHQGGDRDQSAIVTFNASWPVPTDEELASEEPDVPPGTRTGIQLALLVDGARADAVSNQGDVPSLWLQGGSGPDTNGTHGFTFLTQPLAPGDHTIAFLWSPAPFTDRPTFCVEERSIVVQHR